MRSLQVLGQEDLEAVKELRMNLRISRTTQTETQPFKNLNLILSMNLTRHGR